MSGIPEAESDDQSWMQPQPKHGPLPRAGYSDFNPPPHNATPSAQEQTADYTRRIYRFLMGAAIGGVIAFILFIAYILLT